MLSKQRRAEAKLAEEAAKNAALSKDDKSKKSADGAKPAARKEDGPIETTDPMGDALKHFIKPLLASQPNHGGALVMAARAYTRKDRFLLAIRMLRKAAAVLGESDPALHVARAEFLAKAATADIADARVAPIVKAEVAALSGGKPTGELNSIFLSDNQSSFGHRLAGAFDGFLLFDSFLLL